MIYLAIILGVVLLFVALNLRVLKNKTIQKVKQDIISIQEKQIKISDKILINKSYTVDLKTEVNELTNEVIALHQDFIKKHVK